MSALVDIEVRNIKQSLRLESGGVVSFCLMKSPKTAAELDTPHQALFCSTINKAHYTPQGDHPEDRIHRDREYIHRLQRHLDEVYDALEKDLAIKKDSNWLFDFVYNEDRLIEFEEYLAECGVRYKDIVDETKGRTGKQSKKPRRREGPESPR